MAFPVDFKYIREMDNIAHVNFKLNGNWNGIYYQNEQGVRFNMSLKDTNGIIEGTCSDNENDGGNPEFANVSGFVEGEIVSLVKIYPCLWYYDENGNIMHDKNQKHPEIRYYGRIKENKIIGTWEMELNEKSFGYGYFAEVIQGTWEMTKIDI